MNLRRYCMIKDINPFDLAIELDVNLSDLLNGLHKNNGSITDDLASKAAKYFCLIESDVKHGTIHLTPDELEKLGKE